MGGYGAERVGRGGVKMGGYTTVIHLEIIEKGIRTRLADNKRTRNGRLNNETKNKPEKQNRRREKSNGGGSITKIEDNKLYAKLRSRDW